MERTLTNIYHFNVFLLSVACSPLNRICQLNCSGANQCKLLLRPIKTAKRTAEPSVFMLRLVSCDGCWPCEMSNLLFKTSESHWSSGLLSQRTSSLSVHIWIFTACNKHWDKQEKLQTILHLSSCIYIFSTTSRWYNTAHMPNEVTFESLTYPKKFMPLAMTRSDCAISLYHGHPPPQNIFAILHK